MIAEGDPRRDGGDEHRSGRVPPAPVGSADGEPERPGDGGLDDDPDSAHEERHRARGKHRDNRRPRSLPGGERSKGNDRHALESRPHKRHEPPENFEDEREVTQHGRLGKLRRAQSPAELVAHLAARCRLGRGLAAGLFGGRFGTSFGTEGGGLLRAAPDRRP